MGEIKNKKIIFLIFFLLAPVFVHAMDSANYSIDSDVIGAFGDLGTSANFSVIDTGGEVGTGDLSSATFGVLSGFEAGLSGGTISMDCPASVNMGSIVGTGKSNLAGNSITCNINTDSSGGYKLEWAAGSSVAMKSGSNEIAAYSPTVADTPEAWSVDPANSEWGAHLGANSTTKNTTLWGTADTYADGKWLNVDAAPVMIISKNSATSGAGDDEIIFFGSEIGANKFQPTGSYVTNITLTATTL